MSSFHADFKLLTSTVDSLENAKDVYRPDLINFLHKNRDKIIEIGEEHDNCFSLISTDSIENSFDNYSFEMSNLSSDVQTSMDSIYQYSIGSDENISLLNQQYKVSSSDLKNSFDFIVIDPPFITEEAWSKFASFAKYLANDKCKILV